MKICPFCHMGSVITVKIQADLRPYTDRQTIRLCDECEGIWRMDEPVSAQTGSGLHMLAEMLSVPEQTLWDHMEILETRLLKGETIGVFSPSWGVTHDAPEAAERAVQFIEAAGYHVRRGSLWGSADAYRSGSAKARAEEFNALVQDDGVDCLMAAAGGYVTNGMLPFIDFDAYAKNPKPVIGMSDVTALLLALYAKTGFPVYYGPNFVTGFARRSPYREITLQAMLNAVNFEGRYVQQSPCILSAPEHYSDETIQWEKPLSAEKRIPNQLVTVRGGKAKGRLIGGNFCTLFPLLDTPYMPEIREGDILFLEDTEVWAGFIERCAAWLHQSGIFGKIGGLMIGKHRQFDASGTGKKVYEIFADIIGDADFPILAECDFGHCAPMLTVPIGITAELDADARTLRLIR